MARVALENFRRFTVYPLHWGATYPEQKEAHAIEMSNRAILAQEIADEEYIKTMREA